jgi:hypothetical protein
MAKDMSGAPARSANSGADESVSHNVRDCGRTGEPDVGRYQPEEHAPGRTGRTASAKVGGKRLPDVRWQRETILYPALAPDDDLPAAPADVVQFEEDHLSGTQAEPGQ